MVLGFCLQTRFKKGLGFEENRGSFLLKRLLQADPGRSVREEEDALRISIHKETVVAVVEVEEVG